MKNITRKNSGDTRYLLDGDDIKVYYCLQEEITSDMMGGKTTPKLISVLAWLAK